MAWPSRSPDLNSIENAWSILAPMVYADGKQYSNVEELQITITNAWSSIEQNLFKKLISTMPRRVKEVIASNGNTIKS